MSINYLPSPETSTFSVSCHPVRIPRHHRKIDPDHQTPVSTLHPNPVHLILDSHPSSNNSKEDDLMHGDLRPHYLIKKIVIKKIL